MPSGTVGRDARRARLGLDVVLGAEPLDRGLEPQPGLGVVDLGALRALAHLGELALELAALGAQRSSCSADARAASDWRRRCSRSRSWSSPARIEKRVELHAELAVRGVAREQRRALALGLRLRVAVARGEPRLDDRQAAR